MSTDFSGVTFQRQKISPSDDGLIRRKLLADGILYGCDMSYSGSTLTMAAGQLMICGRQIRHPAAQNWAVVDATSGYARLVLTVDLTRTSTKDTFDQVLDTIEYASSLDGFTALETSDINISGTLYQVVLCVVSLGTGGITGITDKLQSIEAAGGGLRARVFGETSAPLNPKENDIWIKTSVAINGCELSDKTLPIGWSMPKGFVYVKGDFGGAYEYRDTTGLNLTVPGTHAVTVYARLTSCIQYNGSAWESKDAWIWHGTQWHQFSATFSARINVVYPAGSTCTISNGSNTYTAPSTSGYWECDVNSAGTWTVTATNGPQSASQSVSITASGQTAGVTLAYDYKIFNAGGAADYSGGWNAYAYKSQSSGSTPKAPTFSVGSTFNIDLYGQYAYNMGTVFSEAAIDLTKYSTLVIEVASTQTGGDDGGFSCGVCAAKQNNWTPVATATNVGAGTHSIDISSLSGSYYLSLSLGGVGQGHTAKAVINRIVLK